ncbi:hypothetical protein GMLC_17960 [Geomonas limicola]|uniref:Methyl-accepting chemotaxis protein n=1 Tax=Geomonas limicola TaxID=2740186 RepID=A0A6V8N8W3_9BACT|nr:methyl-accepting chemotaxis protein [Geomonas limicola]GFO68217.1 hypothetical protein GMLC_17960 [Geomonas limicola]
MATIKSKVIVNVLITFFTLAAIVTVNYTSLKNLAAMQDLGAKRSQECVDMKEASMGGMALYHIIADAIMERKLAETQKEWSERKTEVFKIFDLAVKVADTPEEKKQVAIAVGASKEMVNLFENKLLPALKTTNDLTPEIHQLHGLIDSEVSKVESAMDKVVVSMQKEMKESDELFDQTIQSVMVRGLIIGVVGLLLQAGLAGWLFKAIMKPVDALRLMIMDIAEGEGDLTKRLDESRKDEFAEICRYFNVFLEKLRGIVMRMAQTSGQVSSASQQLASAAEQIAAGAEEVAGQAGTVATAGEEMSATSNDIAINCHNAADGAQRSSRSAQQGAGVVERTVVVMGQIAERVKGSAQTVTNLGARSDQIGAIVETIEDIADQTNLLALNAAIEAARAGEQGRGFAVVADEVRALAERTTRATREIGEMIKAIQRETREAVTAMEEGVQQVEIGTQEAARSGAALEEILSQISEVAGLIQQVATAAEEQNATTGEISSNMQQISRVVQDTASGAHESATVAAQLRRNAEELEQMVGQFKL